MQQKTMLVWSMAILFVLSISSTNTFNSNKDTPYKYCPEIIDINSVPEKVESIVMVEPCNKIGLLYSMPELRIQEEKKSCRFLRSAPSPRNAEQTTKQKKQVWITAYWSYPKQDAWTHKKESSTGVTLKEGKHVAVDPNVIPYGSKVQLPDGTIRKAVDTGGAVKGKVASKGQYIVIDVYFTTQATAVRWLSKYSEKQWVTLL